ncbi:MAG: phosphoribosylaminoimidazolesuccinocarboxamide synthase [bacterium]
MQKPIVETNFQIPGLTKIHTGKVRDVYQTDRGHLISVVTDRISAFDEVLPAGIPYKGQVLNQIASRFLDEAVEHFICPTWKVSEIHPMVTAGIKAKPYMVEIIVRGYVTGSLYRDIYSQGGREICGIELPDGMKEFEKFPKPIVTPTTKAESGHDENISPDEIIARGLATIEEYELMADYALELFSMGTAFAAERGLILVDTKYEFGIDDEGMIILIDEIHTPDSSRYWYEEGYMESFKAGKSPKSLDKEFVRQWLIKQGFKGDPGQEMPYIPEAFVEVISNLYMELYQNVMGEELQQTEYSLEEIEMAIINFMEGVEDLESTNK